MSYIHFPIAHHSLTLIFIMLKILLLLLPPIHADYNKHLGAYKIAYALQHDYGIHISVGKVYRLMKQLQLPKMSTGQPPVPAKHSDHGTCANHLRQNFPQKAPNLLWANDITYIKSGGEMFEFQKSDA